MISKQALGDELVTDFLIRRLDDQDLVVEIERPSTPLFTQTHNFTADFTHAYGQVLGFQMWVDEHGEYARSRIPGISAPLGLVVIPQPCTTDSL